MLFVSTTNRKHDVKNMIINKKSKLYNQSKAESDFSLRMFFALILISGIFLSRKSSLKRIT